MIDIIVVGVYFVFLMAIGWMFRTFSNSTSDYFKGGGKMLWWMVGATAFMTQFSAWSFTGAAGKAFTDGFAVLAIFFGNAVGYLGNYAFFAAKSRQMRVVTPIEGVRLRYGKVNEQAFTWAAVPVSIIQAGIWLNGLAIFAAAVFNLEMEVTIIVTGLIVLLMSVTGGAWAVVASDFLQMVIIMAVSFVASVVAIIKAGGVSEIFANGLPAENPIAGTDVNYMWLFVAWVLCSFIKQFFSTNNMVDSYRYMCAKDSNNARKAALLACVLMFIGPVIWFIPAWFVAATNGDPTLWGDSLNNVLGGSIKDATYYVFVRDNLPVGMIGLMMSAMFAATMSSMDSALNRNAGIVVRDVYKVYFDKDASDEKLLKIGRLASCIFGILIILVGLYIKGLQGTSLFNITTSVGSLLALPMLIPTLFGFFIKKTPDWSGWGTLIVGFAVSYVAANMITIDMINGLLGIEMSAKEFSDFKSLTLPLVMHLGITTPFYFLSMLFYKGFSPERQAEVDLFFDNVTTEVVTAEGEEEGSDNQQRNALGKLLATAGALICLLVLIPQDTFTSRFVFIAVGGIVLAVGLGLVASAKEKVQTA